MKRRQRSKLERHERSILMAIYAWQAASDNLVHILAVTTATSGVSYGRIPIELDKVQKVMTEEFQEYMPYLNAIATASDHVHNSILEKP